MSRVFVAHDEALGRDVVVKVLAPDLAEGLSAERFTREVRTAARLQHPNIVPVLAAGTLRSAGAGAPSGLPYYTMPFIAGASLRARLAEGSLPLGEALTVLRDVLRALACAHAAGVVHRDIKPENVLLTGGAAVVADFGIAKALSAAGGGGGGGGATLTQAGMAVGTPAYMAPEQAAGDVDVDHQADLYAWGLLAWEALVGRHPFAGKTSALALIGAHLTQTPAPLASVRAAVPPALAALVARCLAKAPAERPADASAVLRALDDVSLTPREPLPAAAGERVSGPHERSLVVLPFANLGSDPDAGYFSDGLADELIADLSRVKALRVISRATAMALKNTVERIPTICRQLGVSYALSGSVRRAGPSLRVTVQLVDAATDAPVWAEKYAGTLDDVFAVQERLSREIVDALAVALTPEESARMARRPFDDVRVFECYLRARDELWHFAPTALDRVRDLIARGRALGGDHPRFLGLEGQLLVQLHNFGVDADLARLTEAEAIAEQLLAAEDTRAEGHAVLASVRWRQHRLRDAVRHGREAFALDPTQTGAGFLAGGLAVNYGDLAGARRDHAALAAVDPWGPMTSLAEAAIAWHGGDGAAAVAAMEQATGRWPDDGFMPWFHALALSYAGRVAESAALMDRVAALGRGTWIEHSASAYACALRGDADGVRRWAAPPWYLDFITLDEMKPLPVAEAYARIGDADRALELLAVVVGNGFTDDAFLARHDPMLAPLRGDPRFQRLLEACRASNAGHS